MVLELVFAGSFFVGRVAHSESIHNVRWRNTGNNCRHVNSKGAHATNKKMTAIIRNSQASSMRPWVLTEADADFVRKIMADAKNAPATAQDLPQADPRVVLGKV